MRDCFLVPDKFLVDSSVIESEEFPGLEQYRAVVIVKPLSPGFATTLGNSFRRTLLSSIPSCAITGISIDGVVHALTCLDGVSEDIDEIILNMQCIAFKSDAEQSVLELSADKGGVVRAADISLPPGVSIVNPDAVLFHLSEGYSVKMRMYLRMGIGYVQGGQQEQVSNVPNNLVISSNHSPVHRVLYRVEQDGSCVSETLHIDITTNGAIDPVDAFRMSAKILYKQLGALCEFEETTEEILATEEGADKADFDKILLNPIEDLRLSPRATNSLRRFGIKCWGDVVTKSPDELRDIKSFGQKSLDEVEEALKRHGLSFCMNIDS